MKTNIHLLLSIAAVVGVLGWTALVSRRDSETNDRATLVDFVGGDDAASYASFVVDIPAWVRTAPVIIKGRITAVGTQTWYEPPPTAGPTPTFDTWRPSGIRTGNYYTFYNLRVLEIYKDDGDLEVSDIIQVGVVTVGSALITQSLGSINDEFLTFLTKSPYDDFYYGVYGHEGFGRVSLTSAPVRYENGTPVADATAFSVSEFLEELEDEVSRQGTATITPLPAPTIDPGDTEDPAND